MKATSHVVTPVLRPWQKMQAAMLYHYASLAYLTPLHDMVNNLINGVADPLVDLAMKQGRDAHLANQRWGNRDTAKNWSNNAWPFLKDLQASLAKDVVQRATGEYSITAVNECLRGIAEYSMQWATIQEELAFERALAGISTYSLPHDQTLQEYHNRWKDSSFAHYFQEYSSQHLTIPQFRLRLDVSANTGELPPQTGVYIAHDDPNATLQFVWKGTRSAELRPANTFNEIGLAALREVGREDLWINDEKMFKFAMADRYKEKFRAKLTFADSEWPSAAAGVVGNAAFQTRSCRWSLVECMPGEVESLATLHSSVSDAAIASRRIEGGAPCKTAAYYFTPSLANSRRFLQAGEIAPILGSAYGTTYWQWDERQQ